MKPAFYRLPLSKSTIASNQHVSHSRISTSDGLNLFLCLWFRGIQSITCIFAPRKGSRQRQTLQALKNLTTAVNLEVRFTCNSRLIQLIKVGGSSICHFSNVSNFELLPLHPLENGYISSNLIISLLKHAGLYFQTKIQIHLLASRQTLSALTNCVSHRISRATVLD